MSQEPLPIAIRCAGTPCAVRQLAAQRGVGRVGVAVEAGERLGHRLDHGRDRRIRRLVGGELGDRPLRRVAVGGRIDGDAADLLGELDGHGTIQLIGRRAAKPSSSHSSPTLEVLRGGAPRRRDELRRASGTRRSRAGSGRSGPRRLGEARGELAAALVGAAASELAQREADRVVVDRGHDAVQQLRVHAGLAERRRPTGRTARCGAAGSGSPRGTLLQRRQHPRVGEERRAAVARDRLQRRAPVARQLAGTSISPATVSPISSSSSSRVSK